MGEQERQDRTVSMKTPKADTPAEIKPFTKDEEELFEGMAASETPPSLAEALKRRREAAERQKPPDLKEALKRREAAKTPPDLATSMRKRKIDALENKTTNAVWKKSRNPSDRLRELFESFTEGRELLEGIVTKEIPNRQELQQMGVLEGVLYKASKMLELAPTFKWTEDADEFRKIDELAAEYKILRNRIADAHDRSALAKGTPEQKARIAQATEEEAMPVAAAEDVTLQERSAPEHAGATRTSLAEEELFGEDEDFAKEGAEPVSLEKPSAIAPDDEKTQVSPPPDMETPERTVDDLEDVGDAKRSLVGLEKLMTGQLDAIQDPATRAAILEETATSAELVLLKLERLVSVGALPKAELAALRTRVEGVIATAKRKGPEASKKEVTKNFRAPKKAA